MFHWFFSKKDCFITYFKDFTVAYFLNHLTYLNSEQLKKLDKHLEDHTYSDSKKIIGWIHKEFNITYSKSGIVSLLHRLGYTYKNLY